MDDNTRAKARATGELLRTLVDYATVADETLAELRPDLERVPGDLGRRVRSFFKSLDNAKAGISQTASTVARTAAAAQNAQNRLRSVKR